MMGFWNKDKDDGGNELLLTEYLQKHTCCKGKEWIFLTGLEMRETPQNFDFQN